MINQWLASDAAWRLGWALLHSIWQLAVVAILVAVLLRMLRSSTANVRYIVALCGLLAMYVPLAVTWVNADKPTVYGEPIVAERPILHDVAVRSVLADVARDASPASEATNVAGWIEEVGTELQQRMDWIVGSWLIGVGLLSLWNLGGWLVLVRLRRGGTRLSPAFDERVERLAGRMRVSRPVQVLESMWVGTPLVMGWLRPIILVPHIGLGYSFSSSGTSPASKKITRWSLTAW